MDAANLTRAQKLTLIYRHTHADYKGKANAAYWPQEHAGKKTIMVNGGSAGTILVLLDDLTDEQIAEKLPYALKKEEARLAAKQNKQ